MKSCFMKDILKWAFFHCWYTVMEDDRDYFLGLSGAKAATQRRQMYPPCFGTTGAIRLSVIVKIVSTS